MKKNLFRAKDSTCYAIEQVRMKYLLVSLPVNVYATTGVSDAISGMYAGIGTLVSIWLFIFLFI